MGTFHAQLEVDFSLVQHASQQLPYLATTLYTTILSLAHS